MKEIKDLLNKKIEDGTPEDIKEYSFWLGRLYGLIHKKVGKEFPLDSNIGTYGFVKNLSNKKVEKTQELARVLVTKYAEHLNMDDEDLNQAISMVMMYENKAEKVDGAKVTMGTSITVI